MTNPTPTRETASGTLIAMINPHQAGSLDHFLFERRITVATARAFGWVEIDRDQALRYGFKKLGMGCYVLSPMPNASGDHGVRVRPLTGRGVWLTPPGQTKNTLGLFHAPRHILDPMLENTLGMIVLCEGETDTLTAHQAGYPAIGILGVNGDPVNLAEQLTALGVIGVIMALDGDQAGEKAIHRIGAILTASGITVRVAPIPADQDLNDVWRNNGETGRHAVRTTITSAIPLPQWAVAHPSPAPRSRADHGDPAFHANHGADNTDPRIETESQNPQGQTTESALPTANAPLQRNPTGGGSEWARLNQAVVDALAVALGQAVVDGQLYRSPFRRDRKPSLQVNLGDKGVSAYDHGRGEWYGVIRLAEFLGIDAGSFLTPIPDHGMGLSFSARAKLRGMGLEGVARLLDALYSNNAPLYQTLSIPTIAAISGIGRSTVYNAVNSLAPSGATTLTRPDSGACPNAPNGALDAGFSSPESRNGHFSNFFLSVYALTTSISENVGKMPKIKGISLPTPLDINRALGVGGMGKNIPHALTLDRQNYSLACYVSVMGFLASKRGGSVVVSRGRIARLTGLSTRTLQTYDQRLESLGIGWAVERNRERVIPLDDGIADLPTWDQASAVRTKHRQGGDLDTGEKQTMRILRTARLRVTDPITGETRNAPPVLDRAVVYAQRGSVVDIVYRLPNRYVVPSDVLSLLAGELKK